MTVKRRSRVGYRRWSHNAATPPLFAAETSLKRPHRTGRGRRTDEGDRVVAGARPRESGRDPRLRPLRHWRGTLERVGLRVASAREYSSTSWRLAGAPVITVTPSLFGPRSGAMGSALVAFERRMKLGVLLADFRDSATTPWRSPTRRDGGSTASSPTTISGRWHADAPVVGTVPGVDGGPRAELGAWSRPLVARVGWWAASPDRAVHDVARSGPGRVIATLGSGDNSRRGERGVRHPGEDADERRALMAETRGLCPPCPSGSCGK